MGLKPDPEFLYPKNQNKKGWENWAFGTNQKINKNKINHIPTIKTLAVMAKVKILSFQAVASIFVKCT